MRYITPLNYLRNVIMKRRGLFTVPLFTEPADGATEGSHSKRISPSDVFGCKVVANGLKHSVIGG